MNLGRFASNMGNRQNSARARMSKSAQSGLIEQLESRVFLSVTNSAALLAGTSSPQVFVPSTVTGTVSLTGNGVAITSGATMPMEANFTNFGGTAADGTVPVSRTYTITNTGTGTLTMVGADPVSISGPGAADFTVSASPSAIAPGGTTTFTITFTPITTGAETAVVNLATSDPSSPFTFTVTGTGLASPTSLTGGLLTYTTGTGVGSGLGSTAQDGDILVMNYSGFLTDGTEFDSSLNTGRTPFEFDLGVGAVIAGWDQGLVGLKAGQSRTLIIPAALAYGASGQGSIPANSILIFSTTLIDIISVQGGSGPAAVADSENSPSATNGTAFGSFASASASPVTNTFTVTDPDGSLKNLLASPALSIQGASSFTATQPVINVNGTMATFTVTYTPSVGISDSIVTLFNSAATTFGDPNFTFTVQAEGPTPDNGAVLLANTNVIAGYAFDPLNISTPDKVEIDITGGPAPQTILANQSSPELLSQLGTTSNNFTYTMPVLSAGAHTVSVYAINSTTQFKTLIDTTTITSQNSLFDEHYYLLSNPDVAAAVAAGTIASGYDHYIKYGQFEGRSPSPYWNEAYYLQMNPDVAAAVKAGKISSGFMHYYLYGQYENRPGLEYFNNSYYLANNPDVAAAVSSGAIASGFEHYVLYGQYEGRSPMLYFSPSVYLANNPDLTDFVTGETMPSSFEQFVLYGQYEDRIASNFYNEHTYLADNPDVAAAVRAGEFVDGFQHWLLYGQFEGRTAV